MKDYVIWLGEKLSKIHPKKTWEEIMEIIASPIFNERDFGLSVQEYLKERNGGIYSESRKPDRGY